MNELHNYGLIRFSKRTGKIDTSMTALGRGVIQLWALQNTTKAKACVIVDIDERKVFSEYIGTANGFPLVRKNSSEFEYPLPDELYDIFAAEAKARRNS